MKKFFFIWLLVTAIIITAGMVYAGVDALSENPVMDNPKWMSVIFFFFAIFGILCVCGIGATIVEDFGKPKRMPYSASDDHEKTPEVPKPGKWDFIYEKEVPDIATNQIGILSDGANFLFFHVWKINEEDPIETCQVFNSMDLMDDSMECQYPWTAENDEILLDALNKADRDPFVTGSYCGEAGVLRALKFKPFEKE